MKAYCYASGLIQLGNRTPPGAIQIASGREADLRRVLDVLARRGKGESAGCLLVPGVPEAQESEGDVAKGDALAAWLTWCGQQRHRGVRFTTVLESPSTITSEKH